MALPSGSKHELSNKHSFSGSVWEAWHRRKNVKLMSACVTVLWYLLLIIPDLLCNVNTFNIFDETNITVMFLHTFCMKHHCIVKTSVKLNFCFYLGLWVRWHPLDPGQLQHWWQQSLYPLQKNANYWIWLVRKRCGGLIHLCQHCFHLVPKFNWPRLYLNAWFRSEQTHKYAFMNWSLSKLNWVSWLYSVS